MKARKLVQEWLKNHEVKARASKVGLNFDYEGWNFLLWNDADDPSFFRLTLPGIFDVTEDTYAMALMACNTLNWSYKVVKASLYEFEESGKHRASVWVCYEQQLDDACEPEMVSKAITALMESAERFLNHFEQ